MHHIRSKDRDFTLYLSNPTDLIEAQRNRNLNSKILLLVLDPRDDTWVLPQFLFCLYAVRERWINSKLGL